MANVKMTKLEALEIALNALTDTDVNPEAVVVIEGMIEKLKAPRTPSPRDKEKHDNYMARIDALRSYFAENTEWVSINTLTEVIPILAGLTPSHVSSALRVLIGEGMIEKKEFKGRMHYRPCGVEDEEVE